MISAQQGICVPNFKSLSPIFRDWNMTSAPPEFQPQPFQLLPWPNDACMPNFSSIGLSVWALSWRNTRTQTHRHFNLEMVLIVSGGLKIDISVFISKKNFLRVHNTFPPCRLVGRESKMQQRGPEHTTNKAVFKSNYSRIILIVGELVIFFGTDFPSHQTSIGLFSE